MAVNRLGERALPRSLTTLDKQRVGALVFDLLGLNLVQWWINQVFGTERIVSGALNWQGASVSSFSLYTTTRAVDWPWQVVILFIYFAAQETLFGTTIGKKLVGLRIIGQNGQSLSWQQALIRNLLRPIDALPILYLVGGITAITSPRRQRLGDRAAGTLVLAAADAPEAALPTKNAQRRAAGLLVAVALLFIGSLAFNYWGRPALDMEGLKNTGQFPFEKPMIGYTLGTPISNGDKLTYPVDLQMPGQTAVCHAEVRMEFRGLLDGWRTAGGQRNC